jgi:hypothetical protein
MVGRISQTDATLGLALVLALASALASFDRQRLYWIPMFFVGAQGYAEAVSEGIAAVEPGVFIQGGRL